MMRLTIDRETRTISVDGGDAGGLADAFVADAVALVLADADARGDVVALTTDTLAAVRARAVLLAEQYVEDAARVRDMLRAATIDR